ncbi:MAG: hypothetical protein IJ830_01780 [Alphaproteobacteria bacterium]|nr:hypothetical protein [Alphaproteobacteria bacterium]
MQKSLNLKQFCIDTLSFMAKNVFVLVVFGLASFIASFLSLKYAFKHQTAMIVFYGLFCYVFYYLFVSFYYEQKPLFTSEKIVNSVIKMVVIFALSLFVVICGHVGLKTLKYMAEWLIGFPDIYAFLKNGYYFLNASRLGQFLLYVPMVFFLTFTFFIPGFAWISSINGGDQSLWSAYTKTHGSYIKIALILFVCYALFPFVLSFFGALSPFVLSMKHAIVSVFQITVYLRLYDFFYDNEETFSL